LREAKIANSELYKYLQKDEFFGEKIELFKQYLSVLVNSVIVRQLQIIVEKQNGDETKGIKPQSLSKLDIKFLQWFATNSNLMQEEYGRREKVSVYDPEVEIHKLMRIIEESSIKDVDYIS
jgi:hypothetical protein